MSGILSSAGGNSGIIGQTEIDYEEGTWTPALNNGGSVVVNEAQYTKVGRLVTCDCYINLSSIPNNGSLFIIGGLPFTAVPVNSYAGGSVAYVSSHNVSIWSGPLVSERTTNIYWHRHDGSESTITNSNATGLPAIILQVTYFA